MQYEYPPHPKFLKEGQELPVHLAPDWENCTETYSDHFSAFSEHVGPSGSPIQPWKSQLDVQR